MVFGGKRGAAALGGEDRAQRLAPWMRSATRCGIYLLLGVTMAMARVQEGPAPFGMALVAAAGPGAAGASALMGAALGYLVNAGLEQGIRYIAASVLVYTVAYIARDLPVYRGPLFMGAVAAGVMALTGYLGSFSYGAGRGLPLWAQLLLETTLAFGGAYFFREALSGTPGSTEAEELRHNVALMVLSACLLMPPARLTLLDSLSLGRLLALLLVMASAMKGGMLTGAAVGTVLGLAVDIARAGPPFYAMAYSFCGLFSGAFGRHGRFLFTLSFLLADALAAVCGWGAVKAVGVLLECFCASVLFMLLPRCVLEQVGLILQSPSGGGGGAGLRRYVAGQVARLGEAYGDLVRTAREDLTDPANDEDLGRIYDRAADAVCVDCRDRERCWSAGYLDTLAALNDAGQTIRQNGRLREEDLPERFRASCVDLRGFVGAVNGQLRAALHRRMLRERLRESESAAWDGYATIARVLGQVAGELGSTRGPEPLAERRLQRYLRTIELDAETAVYRDATGRLHVTIESGRLAPLTGQEGYLEKLSAVVGTRLCRPEGQEGQARLCLLEAEPLAVAVGIAAMKKQGEQVCGDRGSYFKTDAGVLCVILSDGMGTGDAAARDAERVVSILEKFLKCGTDPAMAMQILNAAMLLRGEEGWGFATVDLMCVDLFSGETCFYKYGAAPSYVKSGRSVRRIRGESLAAGLSPGGGTAPDVVRMRLEPGCTAVIASDGVIAETEDAWIRELMAGDFTDMKGLARTVLREAEKRYGAADDMTAIALRLEERA